MQERKTANDKNKVLDKVGAREQDGEKVIHVDPESHQRNAMRNENGERIWEGL